MIPGYDVSEALGCSQGRLLVRAQRRADAQAVLLELSTEAASAADFDALERQARLLEGLELSGLPRLLERVRQPRRTALVLSDPGGLPLSRWLEAGPLGVEPSLCIALGVSAILVELHRREVVLRCLHPGGILVQSKGWAVALVELHVASRSSSEAALPVPLDRLRDTLPYISPEQTGRMNRSADYRTDLYSLGITLYESLTGRPPHQSSDALELIHCHIARTPKAPSELDGSIPRPLSEIVMRLLAKTPEERYQSAAGVRADLQRCLDEWQRQRHVAPFVLGRQDVSDRFSIPQRLYGREPEVARLAAAFQQACAGHSSLLLVEGYSGVGKTSLILELARPIVQERGYFLSGKFDQVVRSVPFGALLQAFRGLVRQLLGESTERLNGWRERIAAALGSNAGVLTEVLPELAWVLGKQPPAVSLGPTEALNRFQLVLQKFLATLAQPQHPIVLFLDDLQWADAATLSVLLPLLTSPEVRCLLVIGAYRENEVHTGHPLRATLSGIQAAGGGVEELRVGPLALWDLTRLVSDVLRCDLGEAEPLARLVLAKTLGNPLFVTQFLRTLKEEGWLEFDYACSRWRYRLGEIASAEMTDNVIDLMTRKLERLSDRTRRALTLAACIGNSFDAETLGVVSDQPPEHALGDLDEAIQEGLIVAANSSHELRPPSAGSAGVSYAFSHDRVQQLAYSLIPREQREVVHLQVGRLLWGRADVEGSDERLFDIAHHLNVGSALSSDAGERRALARLNWRAGGKAKNATANEAALGYFQAGIALLTEDSWQADYELAFELALAAAEAQYRCGNFEDADQGLNQLLGRAQTNLDRARVYNLAMLQCENRSQYAAALAVARRSLALFGVALPESLSAQLAALETEIAQIARLVGAREIASLIDLPVMRDAETRMLMNILTDIWSPAYILGEATLARLISAIMVRLSLLHGNLEESAYGYVTHAISVGPVRGDYRSAYEFGRLALAVNQRFADSRRRAKIHQQFHAHVALWRQPFESCLAYAQEACKSGLESGDFLYASYGAATETWPALACTNDLAAFVRSYTPSLVLTRRLKVHAFSDALLLMLNWARALQGQTEAPLSLSAEGLDERRYVEAYGNNPFFTLFHQVARLQICYLLGAPEQACAAAERAHALRQHLAGTIWPVWVDFWGGLTLAAQCSGPPDPALRQRLEGAHARLRVLAENCAENFACQSWLLGAELDRIEGRTEAALAGLARAIAFARQSSSLQYEALGNELCGQLSLRLGRTERARALLREARDAYRRWGASAKCEQLDSLYRALWERPSGELTRLQVPERAAQRSETRSSAIEPAALDLFSVMKAAQAISRETELGPLLGTLLRIVLENAGAERGALVLEDQGELFVHAQGSVERAEVQAQEGLPLRGARDLAESVVHYVCRTHEAVVSSDARQDPRWASDPYVRGGALRSLMCLPVLQPAAAPAEAEAAVSGVLYLENNLVSDAFTPERTLVCQLLASHAAIALANARLFAVMRREIAARREAEQSARLALEEVERLRRRLEAENVYLQEEIRADHNFDEIVGSGPALLEALGRVARVATTDSTVLIQGETGTGKELIARAIHSRSNRRDRPLVKVNCGAISAGLVESELFGHVRGAFTGATDRRIGRFELAHGGTLFLDEVGELGLDTQVKLLRVLQEGEFDPVGSSKTVRVDVRIIAATNRDLELAVRAGRFRSDLFYRLNVLPITAPPLRERRSDIPQLAHFFLQRFARQLGKPTDALSAESLAQLLAYDWPGNIRELQNVMERGVVLSCGRVLALDRDLLPTATAASRPTAAAAPVASSGAAAASGPPTLPSTTPPASSPSDALEEVQRRHILAVLERTRGTVEGPNGAAKLLGLHPNTLRSRLKKLGLR